MKNQIIITGITNMGEGYICISGYDLIKKKYIRPVLPNSPLLESLLTSYNNKIALGSMVEFDLINSEIVHPPPHIEDTLFDPSSVRVLSSMVPIEFQKFLTSIADECVESIFDYQIELFHGQPILPKGSGGRSLGAIISRNCMVSIDHRGKPRCDFVDQRGYEYRHLPIVGRDEWVKKPGNYTNVPLRLSLTRLYQKDKHSEPVYWMQVSGVITT